MGRMCVLGACVLLAACAAAMDVPLRKGCEGATFALAESIPRGTNLTTQLTTADAWLDMIARASRTLDIAGLYITLTGGAAEGQAIFDAVARAARRGVRVRLAISAPSGSFPDTELGPLADAAGPLLSVTRVDMPALFGSGVLHTKFIVADDADFYVGSANLDWRSLTEVKELGAVVRGCPLLAADLRKTFEVYLYAGEHGKLPHSWPAWLETPFGAESPAHVVLNGDDTRAYLSSAPAKFCPRGRTNDIDALVASIAAAKTSIAVEVMDYFPTTLYDAPRKLWMDIDNALRAAAFERNVTVRLLVSHWQYTVAGMDSFLRSLDAIDGIEVRIMTVPVVEPYVPFTRVNHAKFMVTDAHAIVCTSNWVGDYFLTTAGVSLVLESPAAVASLSDVFERDWASEYARPLGCA